MAQEDFFLPPGCVEEKFIRSGGHGGQNVNKTATAVQLRFSPALSGLPREAAERIAILAGNRLAAGGDIIISASEYRTQEQNRRAARARLRGLIARALRPPRGRISTKPTRASKLRRLENKKLRSEIKQFRRKP